MKTQVYDRFGSGLIVLIILTIAVVAGQAQTNFNDAAATEDLPLRIELSIELSEAPVAEPGDSSGQ
jgi:hypothetical protein